MFPLKQVQPKLLKSKRLRANQSKHIECPNAGKSQEPNATWLNSSWSQKLSNHRDLINQCSGVNAVLQHGIIHLDQIISNGHSNRHACREINQWHPAGSAG